MFNFFSSKKNTDIKKIIISRTDNIGDTVLTLPVVGIIKKKWPKVTVAFLGSVYTQPIIKQCRFVDEFYDWPALQQQNKGLAHISADAIIHVFPRHNIARAAKKANIAHRIGASRKWYHWYTCNQLVNLWPKGRDIHMHEAQLSLKLLAPLGLPTHVGLKAVPPLYGWPAPGNTDAQIRKILKKNKFNLIFHIKSNKHGKEWPSENYQTLAQQLPKDRYRILITGSKAEGEQIKAEVPDLFALPHVLDVTGLFDVKRLLTLISHANGLLASGTGPLHIAAAAGIHTLGLFPYYAPIHANRWAPLGQHANFLIDNKTSKREEFMQHIAVEKVKEYLLKWHIS